MEEKTGADKNEKFLQVLELFSWVSINQQTTNALRDFWSTFNYSVACQLKNFYQKDFKTLADVLIQVC